MSRWQYAFEYAKPVAFVIVVFGVSVVLANLLWPEPKPGTPEYQRKFEEGVALCTYNTMRDNLRKTHLELPVLPTRATVEAQCRDYVRQGLEIYP